MAITFNDISELNDFMVEQEIIRNTNEMARIEHEKTRAELFDKLQTLENNHIHGEVQRQANEVKREELYYRILGEWRAIQEDVATAKQIVATLETQLESLGAGADQINAALDAARKQAITLTQQSSTHGDKHFVINIDDTTSSSTTESSPTED